MSKLLVALLLAYSTVGYAALCKTMTMEGKPVFMFKADKPTKTLSGTVANLLLCPEQPAVIVRKEIIQEYVVTNPQNTCERSAQLACEPSFGGLPICTTNNLANFCGFCLVTTKSVEGMGDVTLRYINGAVYDGSKSINNVATCPNPNLLK
jgi:hypothetical protein